MADLAQECRLLQHRKDPHPAYQGDLQHISQGMQIPCRNKTQSKGLMYCKVLAQSGCIAYIAGDDMLSPLPVPGTQVCFLLQVTESIISSQQIDPPQWADSGQHNHLQSGNA